VKTDWKDILLNIGKKYRETINMQFTKDNAVFQGELLIVPPQHLIFNAFDQFNIDQLKVCIIGMDPYIKRGEAMGLSFSVPEGIKCPPSLRNIFKELHAEFGIYRENTNLTDWAQQGILLLNTALTTIEGKTGHHIKIWKDFIQDVLVYITKNCGNIVYILWGNHAQQFEDLIDTTSNLVLKHSHPSPLSRKPFVGNNHFKMCNEYLKLCRKKEITWVPNS
jgi:uracil-DNA glycosylase